MIRVADNARRGLRRALPGPIVTSNYLTTLPRPRGYVLMFAAMRMGRHGNASMEDISGITA